MTDTPEMWATLLAERDTRIAELEQRLAELLATPVTVVHASESELRAERQLTENAESARDALGSVLDRAIGVLSAMHLDDVDRLNVATEVQALSDAYRKVERERNELRERLVRLEEDRNHG